VIPFERVVLTELTWLVRAGAPPRAVRLTVRELVSARIEQGPLGASAVGDTVEATVRAACDLARELDAADELVESVCRAALESVRGHGGESARWLAEATHAAHGVLLERARERAEDPRWRWLVSRLADW
jgi:hypothetical protein